MSERERERERERKRERNRESEATSFLDSKKVLNSWRAYPHPPVSSRQKTFQEKTSSSLFLFFFKGERKLRNESFFCLAVTH